MTDELTPSENIDETSYGTRKEYIKVFTIVDEKNGFKITMSSRAELHISDDLPISVKGTLIIDDLHVPIIDFQAKNGYPPQQITRDSCIVITQNKDAIHNITRGAFHEDITTVLEIIKDKL